MKVKGVVVEKQAQEPASKVVPEQPLTDSDIDAAKIAAMKAAELGMLLLSMQLFLLLHFLVLFCIYFNNHFIYQCYSHGIINCRIWNHIFKIQHRVIL